MKNIKKQLVNYRNAMVMHAWKVKNKLKETSGEGYVDTAIKILISSSCAFSLPTLVRRVQEMFDYSG